MKLRKKQGNHGEDQSSSSVGLQADGKGKAKVKKSKAERQKEYRMRIKADPEKYKEQLETSRMRSKLWRLERSEAGKEHDRQLGKERARRFRERTHGNSSGTAAKKTRRGKSAQADKWKEQKRKQRAEMTVQKRRRVNEKRREQYSKKKEEAALAADQTMPSAFKSDSAKRKAVSRSWRILPSSPNKFAEVFSDIVGKATPKRKSALRKKCILSPGSKKKLSFYRKTSIKHVLQNIRKKRSIKALELRKQLHHLAIVKNKLKKKTAHKQLGLSWNFLSRRAPSRKKRKDAVSADTIKVVKEFYTRIDISRELPCQATKHASKRVMECSLKTAYTLFTKENPTVQMCFSSFYKLRPKNIHTMSKTKLLQCLCEYCINVEILLNTLRSKSQQERHSNIGNKYEVVNATLCPSMGFPDRKCLARECEDCGVNSFKQRLLPLLETHASDQVKWKEWTSKSQEEEGRMALIDRSGTLMELVTALLERLAPFAKHLLNARWQAQQFSSLKQQVPKNWTVLCMDFGENYNCHYQDEAQSAHWHYNQATIHSVVAYYNCSEVGCDQTCRESIIMISDDRKHDYHAVQHSVHKVNEHLQSSGIEITNQVHFSDGAPTQYKNKTSFADMTHGREDFGFPIEKHFFGSRHGKGPCDGEIGVVKRVALMLVKTRQAVIGCAQDLYREMKGRLTIAEGHIHSKRTFFYIPSETIQRERGDRTDGLKPVKDTRTKHSFKSSEAFVVTSRERSCFCKSCVTTTEGCPNVDITGSWEESILVAKPKPANIITSAKSVIPPREDAAVALEDSSQNGRMATSPGMSSQQVAVTNVSTDAVSMEAASSRHSNMATVPNSDSAPQPDVQKGDFAAVLFSGKQSHCIYMAEVLEVVGEEVHLKYMKKRAGDLYIWPTIPDASLELKTSIVCRVNYPQLATKRDQFCFAPEDLQKIKQCCSKQYELK